MFGASASTTPAFGTPSTPFGTPSSTSLFGTPPAPTSLFGTPPASTPAFGSPFSSPAFGTPSTPAFGTPSTPAFGAQFTPAFGTPSTPAFGTPSTPAFGTPSTPAFGGSLFSTPFSQQQQTSSLFQTPQPQQQQQNFFGVFPTAPQTQTSPFGNVPLASNFMTSQLTTQMAPVAPLPFSLADRDIQAIVDAYKEDAGNLKYAFKHLLFSVTDPQCKVKPSGVSDIMWAEAIAKLEGMESSNRERLWPQLVQGFKDLSHRLKLQDEVIQSDSERLKMTQGNVKMLKIHFHADIVPWIQRMQQKEQGLQRRLLRVMRIIEALEGKGGRLPLMKGEVELADKLAAIVRQLRGSGAELSRRVQSLLTLSRLQVDGVNGSINYLPGSARIQERSLDDMQKVLQRQTEAIARLGNVLKRDMRDMEIIMAEDTEMEI